MSVLHTLQIAPKSGTITTLKEVQSFINTLTERGFIEKEFAIFTGDAEKIRGINSWNFVNHSIKSPLTKGETIEFVDHPNFANLFETKNYAFKVHLLKSNSTLAKLAAFNETELLDFPVFISLLSAPADYTLFKEDPETEEFEEIPVNNFNCLITSDGRNSKSLWDLAQNPENFTEFYDQIRSFFGEFEIGSFYS